MLKKQHLLPQSEPTESTEFDTTLRALILANADIAFVIDRNGQFIECYSEKPKMLYVPVEQLLGKSISLLLPDYVSQLTFDKLKKVFETGDTESYVYYLGDQPYRSTIVKIDEERAIALIKNIEEETTLRQDLEKTRRNYRQMVEMMPLGVMICRPVYDSQGVCIDLEVLSVNSGYRTIAGETEITGKFLCNVFSLSETAWLNDCLTSVNTGKTVIQENYDPWMDKWLFLTAYPMGPDEFIMILTDLGKTSEQRYLIRKNEERHSFALKNSHTFVWEWTPELQLNYVSESVTSILGYKRREIPRNIDIIASFCHPDDICKLTEIQQKFTKAEINSFSVQFRLKNKAGKYVWFDVQGKVAAYDAGMRPKRVIGSCIDIDRIKNNEQALAEREALLRSVFDKSPIGICLFNSSGEIVAANAAAYHCIGVSHDSKLEGINLFDNRLLDDNRIGLLKNFSDLDFSEWTRNEDFIPLGLKVEQPRKMFLRYQFTPLIINVDCPEMNRILLQITDHTLEKEQERSMLLSKKYHENAMEISKLAFWSYFYEEKEFNRSAEFLRLFGLDKDLSRSFVESILSVIDSDDDMQKIIQYVDIIRQGKADELDEIEVKVKSHNEYRYLFAKSTPVFAASGDLLGVFGVIQDITGRKQLEMELIEAKNKAEESDRLKTAFLANMSHEIRTPLNSIVGFSGLLANDVFDQEKRTEFVKRIEFNCNHLLNLITDIIDFAKIESGTIVLSCEEVLLKELLMSVAEANKLNCRETVLFRSDFSAIPENCIIETDQVKLIQILTNILNNAFKFTEKGSVVFSGDIADGMLKIEVRDTGIGISEIDLKHIFERFFQSNHMKTGTGLGLAICKSLVIAMGGNIGVQSELGKGSVFHVLLPIKKQ